MSCTTSIVIIGGGVTGASIARELSRYDVQITLLEKEIELGFGATGANGGTVHSGHNPKPGTLKAKLNAPGNKLMGEVCEELDVPFERLGMLVLAFSQDEIPQLEELKEQGVKNGVPGLEIVGRDFIIQREPHINKDVVAALFLPTAGIVSPFELTVALAENAVQNGAKFMLETEARAIVVENGQTVGVKTNRGFIPASIVINAAGVYADKIAKTAGDDSFTITPRKGQQVILDKETRKLVTGHMMTLPTALSKGFGITPTTGGNLHLGSTAEHGVGDLTTTRTGVSRIIKDTQKMIPALSPRDVITSFAGVRPAAHTEDFIIEKSGALDGLFHAAGIQSPGLASSQMIARYLVEVMKDSGVSLKPRNDFNPVRRSSIKARETSLDRWDQLIKEDPAYGRIVCRCERVTEAEIVAAIRSPLGARTIEGVKRRTRAGMGRCQGGFCSPRVVEILSRELKIPREMVTRRGRNSYELLPNQEEGCR